MPKLRKNNVHNCLFCDYQSKRRNIKTHLTKLKKDGKTRCPGLKKVLSANEWDEKILPYFRDGAELREIGLKTFQSHLKTIKPNQFNAGKYQKHVYCLTIGQDIMYCRQEGKFALIIHFAPDLAHCGTGPEICTKTAQNYF